MNSTLPFGLSTSEVDRDHYWVGRIVSNARPECALSFRISAAAMVNCRAMPIKQIGAGKDRRYHAQIYTGAL